MIININIYIYLTITHGFCAMFKCLAFYSTLCPFCAISNWFYKSMCKSAKKKRRLEASNMLGSCCIHDRPDIDTYLAYLDMYTDSYIHIYKYIYIWIYMCVTWHTQTCTHTYIYIYIFIKIRDNQKYLDLQESTSLTLQPRWNCLARPVSWLFSAGVCHPSDARCPKLDNKVGIPTLCRQTQLYT